jgi:hypothetical protein
MPPSPLPPSVELAVLLVLAPPADVVVAAPSVVVAPPIVLELLADVLVFEVLVFEVLVFEILVLEVPVAVDPLALVVPTVAEPSLPNAGATGSSELEQATPPKIATTTNPGATPRWIFGLR